MDKKHIFISLCTALILCVSNSASAALTNIYIGGDRVVYDCVNGLFNEIRSTQESFIADLNKDGYAGITSWEMANWKQTSGLKWSLASMATDGILSWDFDNMSLPDPLVPDSTPDDRDWSSPYLAWSVYPQDFFPSTAGPDFEIFGMPGMVFNGRTAGWGMTNTGTDGFGGEVVWMEGTADDHWMLHGLATNGDLATMMFNMDQHYLDDNATDRGFIGGVSAWIVSSNGPSQPCPVPAPGTLLLSSMGVALVGWLRRRRTL